MRKSTQYINLHSVFCHISTSDVIEAATECLLLIGVWILWRPSWPCSGVNCSPSACWERIHPPGTIHRDGWMSGFSFRLSGQIADRWSDPGSVQRLLLVDELRDAKHPGRPPPPPSHHSPPPVPVSTPTPHPQSPFLTASFSSSSWFFSLSSLVLFPSSFCSTSTHHPFFFYTPYPLYHLLFPLFLSFSFPLSSHSPSSNSTSTWLFLPLPLLLYLLFLLGHESSGLLLEGHWARSESPNTPLLSRR